MLALSWSGGKDSALALEALRAEGRPPDLLLTTVDEESGAVPHHEVPNALLRSQGRAAGVFLVEIRIPRDADDVTYGARMRAVFDGPLRPVTAVAFGDLFLEDLRAFREARMAEAGREAIFPLWGRDTAALARDFAARYEAVVCAIDREQFPDGRPGVAYDEAFLDALPAGVDPCGENGEFHTFVHAGPCFTAPVPFTVAGEHASADGRFTYGTLGPPDPSA